MIKTVATDCMANKQRKAVTVEVQRELIGCKTVKPTVKGVKGNKFETAMSGVETHVGVPQVILHLLRVVQFF